MNVQQIVEAVLFASDAPLTASEIARADESLDEDQVEQALQTLRAEYDDAGRSFQIVELAEGHQILTRAEFAPYLERFDNVPRPSRLSGPALETLAIIAYRQPIGRLEMEYIRGVGVSGVIRTLQERNLIDVVGRAEGLGRPLLYGTTRHFLEHFGFRSLEGLPRPEELPIVLRERIPLGPEDPLEEAEAEGAEADGQGTLDLSGEPAQPQGDPDAGAVDVPSSGDDAGDPQPENNFVGLRLLSVDADFGAEDDGEEAVRSAQAAAKGDGDEVFEPDR
jgi:segregation and condensation protein B